MRAFLLIPVVFFIAMVAAMVWFSRRLKATGRTASGQPGPLSSTPPQVTATPKLAAGCLLVFFAPFLVIGSVLLYQLLVRPVMQVLAARNWEKVPCTILASQVTSHPGDDGATYSIEIEYRYAVGGEEYTSRRHDFVGGSTGARADQEAVVERYPAGSRAECLVNPQRPTEAVLDGGFAPGLLFGLVPLVFVLVGAGGMGFGLFLILGRQRQRSPLSGGRPLPAYALPSAGPRLTPAAEMVAGAPVLRPRASPVGRLAGALFLALFWNGIVSVFVCLMVQEWRRGQGQWFPTLFMTPFVLIGLALLGVVGYLLLALANPRPRLTVSSTAVPLGGRMDVRWEFSGRSERISHLRVWLEGREEATYRRGTDSRTDKAVFVRLELADTTDRRSVRAGAGSATLPADTMHSFTAAHNKIVWSLQVHGDIARWPDVQEEFPFTVLAAAIPPRTT